jgi:transcriptional regulator with XRE-family HTH domain
MEQKKWERKVGQNVRAFRNKRGFTLQNAADSFGCTLRAWQKFETGTNMELFTLVRIAKVLNVEPKELLK